MWSDVIERALEVQWLGSVPYAQALALQADLVQARRAGDCQDQLLLLEHPHVITLGTSARAEHVLADASERMRRGIELFDTGRGGDVTYHGPGQLIGYPILDLKPDRCDLHRYVRDIEDALMRALGDLDIRATRRAGLTGVWIEDRKIAAIGVRVSSGWITSHGFALNVTTDLSYFSSIVPCGIAHCAVTSIERERGREIDMAGVRAAVAARFAQVFARTLAVDVATA
jgi:lipoyl(octanoyl) transferase